MMIIKWILLIAMFEYSRAIVLQSEVKAPVESCGVNKECMNFLLCENGKLVTDGDHMVDLRSRRDLHSDVCPHYLDLCCEIPNIIEKSTPTPITIATKCGTSNLHSIGMRMKETADHEAQFGEFPWMVAVLEKVDIFGEISSVYHCGGSLIHPSVVLTIGHSVSNEIATDLIVRAGEWDTGTTHEPLPYVESNVTSMKVHEKLHRGTGTNNIALLFLETPIANADHINTICLPPPHMKFDGARCFVAGWGKDKFDVDGSYQAILKKVDMPIIEKKRCTNMLRKTRLGRHFNLNESLICAGGEAGKDSCKGDGGSPLVCPVPDNEGYYYQAGIVAWGVGCGGNNIPGAYTNVAFFADWIEEQLHYEGYNSSSYTF